MRMNLGNANVYPHEDNIKIIIPQILRATLIV
jgi:hypothetical protein